MKNDMRLDIKCIQCGKENKAPHYETNRADYAKQFGVDFELRCCKCGYTGIYEVDDIKASPQLARHIASKIIWILLSIYAIIVSIHFLPFSLLFAVPLLAITFEGVRRNRDKEKASVFNRNWLKKDNPFQFSNPHSDWRKRRRRLWKTE